MSTKRSRRAAAAYTKYARDAATEQRMRGHVLAGIAKRRTAVVKSVDPDRLAERRSELLLKGLLSDLDASTEVEVILPGGLIGCAYGLTEHGFVQVRGWDEPFNPKAIRRA